MRVLVLRSPAKSMSSKPKQRFGSRDARPNGERLRSARGPLDSGGESDPGRSSSSLKLQIAERDIK